MPFSPVTKLHLNYHPDQWGAPECGYEFYALPHEYVRATRVTWLARKQTEYFFANMHHVWARWILETKQSLVLYFFLLIARREMLKSTTNVFWRRPWRSNHPAFLCQENLTGSVDTTFTGNLLLGALDSTLLKWRWDPSTKTGTSQFIQLMMTLHIVSILWK